MAILRVVYMHDNSRFLKGKENSKEWFVISFVKQGEEGRKEIKICTRDHMN